MSHSSHAFSQFREHLSKRIAISDEDFEIVCSYATIVHVKKKQLFLAAGDVCKHEAYIVKGVMREFMTDDKGHEHVVQLAFDDWWIADMMSFITGQPANYSIEALEDCEIILFDREKENEFLDRFPQFERFFKILIQNAFVALQQRMISNMSHSAEQRYLNLIKKFPQLELRVAQHHIASYLGITPEALSRIKRKLIEHDKNRT